jgi:hypothetical protein
VLSGRKEDLLVGLIVVCEMRIVVRDVPFCYIVRQSPAVVFLIRLVVRWGGRGKTFKEELLNFSREACAAKSRQ